MNEPIRPIATRAPLRPRVISTDAVALAQRLEQTSRHLHGIADVLEYYVAGAQPTMPALAKALQTSVEQLHIIARMNEHAISKAGEQP